MSEFSSSSCDHDHSHDHSSINSSSISHSSSSNCNLIHFDESSDLKEVFRQVRLFIDRGDTSLELLQVLDFCEQRVYSEGLISKNEELDDFSTASIQVYSLTFIFMLCNLISSLSFFSISSLISLEENVFPLLMTLTSAWRH